MLNIQRIVCNMFQENCYIVSDDTKECVIIDCGAFYEEVEKGNYKLYKRQPTHSKTSALYTCTY